MALVAPAAILLHAATLPRLPDGVRALSLERRLTRPARGLSTLASAPVWLALARRDSGRPHHLDGLDEPLPTTATTRRTWPSRLQPASP